MAQLRADAQPIRALYWLLRNRATAAREAAAIIGEVLENEPDATATQVDQLLQRIHTARPGHPDLILALMMRHERLRWGRRS